MTIFIQMWSLFQNKIPYYPVTLHLSPATRILNENPAMGFITHRRLENSLPTMHNSPVQFQCSMAIFYSDESDVDTLC